MKAPMDKPQFTMTSFLSLKLANQERKRKFTVEKLLKAGTDLEDIEIETKITPSTDELPNEIRVMIIGKLENPRLQCLRELKHDSNFNMIPLGVKKSGAQ